MNKKLARNSITLLAATSLALGTVLVSAPSANAEKVLNGAVCAQRVNNLTSEITWLSSLDEAKLKAKKEKKLILWINMLGKLEGDT